MTKIELIKILSKATGSTLKVSEKHFNAIFKVLANRITNEGSLLIPHFGTFKVISRKARRGVNPQTGERIMIPANRTIAFRPTRELRWSVNGELNEQPGLSESLG